LVVPANQCSSSMISDKLIRAAKTLRKETERMTFSAPITHVYNPLIYAWAPHEMYLARFGASRKKVVFLGMNPGPFGMVQTGVPFGEISAVKNWLRIEGPIGRPKSEHPRRRITGFDCPRSEISGQRLWGLFADRFETADRFFSTHIVLNYCPLAFLESSGRNRTPDKLTSVERTKLGEVCDRHLLEVVTVLCPEWVIGIGDFASRRAEQVLSGSAVKVGRILHPSPASPAANRDWAGVVARQLETLKVWDQAKSARENRS